MGSNKKNLIYSLQIYVQESEANQRLLSPNSKNILNTATLKSSLSRVKSQKKNALSFVCAVFLFINILVNAADDPYDTPLFKKGES